MQQLFYYHAAMTTLFQVRWWIAMAGMRSIKSKLFITNT